MNSIQVFTLIYQRGTDLRCCPLVQCEFKAFMVFSQHHTQVITLTARFNDHSLGQIFD